MYFVHLNFEIFVVNLNKQHDFSFCDNYINKLKGIVQLTYYHSFIFHTVNMKNKMSNKKFCNHFSKLIFDMIHFQKICVIRKIEIPRSRLLRFILIVTLPEKHIRFQVLN